MNEQQTDARGISPQEVLRQHPGPWNAVTYTDGTIRVFDGAGHEVGLLNILAFATGVVQASMRKAADAQAA